MLLLENIGECVFCIGDKNLIPGTEPKEVTKEEAEHPTVKAYIKAKKLSLSEVADKAVEGHKTDALEDMTVVQLKEYAAGKQYDINGLSSKADILAKIKELEV
jgi:hypothetical protein